VSACGHVRKTVSHALPIMIAKIYALHRETIMVAPQIEWSASIEKDIQSSSVWAEWHIVHSPDSARSNCRVLRRTALL
jgi:hypothetical protein